MNNGPVCDTFHGANPMTCAAQQAYAAANLQYQRNWDALGYVGVGVGGAALVTGVVLLLTGDDPHRYDRRPATTPGDDTFAGRARPLVWRSASGGGVGLSGTF